MRFFIPCTPRIVYVRTESQLLFSDFLPLNPSPQVGTVKEHGRAVCNLDVGEFPFMGQFPQEPFAHAEEVRGIAAANQALEYCG